MKVFSLYDKDKTFLGAFPSRDMCVTYAKVLHPNADGWDYDVVEEYLTKTPFTTHNPSLSYSTVPDTMIDPTKPSHVNYWIGTKAELAQGHRRKDLDAV